MAVGLLAASVTNAAAAPVRPNSVGTATVAAAKVSPAVVRAGTRTSDSSGFLGLTVLPAILISAVVIAAIVVVADDDDGNSP